MAALSEIIGLILFSAIIVLCFLILVLIASAISYYPAVWIHKLFYKKLIIPERYYETKLYFNKVSYIENQNKEKAESLKYQYGFLGLPKYSTDEVLMFASNILIDFFAKITDLTNERKFFQRNKHWVHLGGYDIFLIVYREKNEAIIDVEDLRQKINNPIRVFCYQSLHFVVSSTNEKLDTLNNFLSKYNYML